jgi:hypothetical protein
MASTYTDDLGIEKPGTGDQVGSWGVTDNLNYDIINQAIAGYVSITPGGAGNSTTPNEIEITDGALSDGRNPFISITGDFSGADVYIRIGGATDNDHKKIGWFENNTTDSDLYVFQGSYSASNDYVIAQGDVVLLRCDGGGAGAVVSRVVDTATTTLQTEMDALQGRHWTIVNGVSSASMGDRILANNHGGYALTMPSTFANTAGELSDIWVANGDDASTVTLTPSAGDAFFVNGVTKGAGITHALNPGEVAILSPRTTDSEWDLVIVIGSTVYTNLVIGTAALGIDFSVNTGTTETGAATTSELFDHYEEGTWTPELTAPSGSGTANQQNGWFERIGRRVFFNCQVSISSKGTMSGAIRVDGLPYPTASGSGGHHSTAHVGYCQSANITAGHSITGRIVHNSSTRIDLQVWDGTGGPSNLLDTEINATFLIEISGHYLMET